MKKVLINTIIILVYKCVQCSNIVLWNCNINKYWMKINKWSSINVMWKKYKW